jgi:UTP-glucose-1-phosphate uridylyltransferase/mevalonate kinase
MHIFVPGRICLFGEHSDWAGGYRRINAAVEKGYTIITGTNQGIHAEVEPHPSCLVLKSRLPDGQEVGPYSIPMDKKALLHEAEQGGFFSYAAGVASQILTHYHVKGLVIDCTRMDLPLKKGLSSSAAISVLTARAFNRVYDLKMTTRGEMEYAYQGELLTPSRCGRMDQGCAYGQRPLMMTFDGDRLDVAEIPVKNTMHFLIVDLCAGKDTVEILGNLNHCYPFPQSDLDRDVQRGLGEINKTFVHETVQAIRDGDAERLGRLMREAQQAFDRYVAPACPSQLTAPVLHKVLEYPALQPLVHGGKGVGSQGDGTAQFVCRDAESRTRAIDVIERELGMKCLQLDIAPPTRVRKAVIPVAGFGTRLYPASKAVKKELFPIVDRDGIAKPAILKIIEEALAGGIEEICLIVQERDREVFDQFFNMPLPVENQNKLPSRFRDYPAYLADIARRVHFAIQDRQEGFGHAVYCTREWVGNEPFLLLLGDHLYRSNTDVSCTGQLLDIFEKHQRSVIGLMVTPEAEIGNFGTVAGEWIDENEVLNITEFAEKPTVDYAREKLSVEGMEPGKYLTVFGQYVLQPEIFEILGEHIDGNLRQRGEFQLTAALDELRKRNGFLGTMVQGRRYDIGTPEAYVRTMVEFATETE